MKLVSKQYKTLGINFKKLGLKPEKFYEKYPK